MDMKVTARTCRYDNHEYLRGETIYGVKDNHAKVLRATGRAEPLAGPIGQVGGTVAAPQGPVDTLEFPADGGYQTRDLQAEAAREPDDVVQTPSAPARGRYRRRDMRAED